MSILPIAKNLDEHLMVSQIYAHKLSKVKDEIVPDSINLPLKTNLEEEQKVESPILFQEINSSESSDSHSTSLSQEIGRNLDLTF